MATYNLGNTGVSANGIAWQGQNRLGVVEVVVDFSRRTGLNVPSGGYASGDVIQLLDIPKGAYLMYAEFELLVAEGSAHTFTGATTGTAFTLFSAGTSLNGTPNTPTAANVTVGLFTSNSVFALTLGGTLTNGGTAKAAFHFVFADLRSVNPSSLP